MAGVWPGDRGTLGSDFFIKAQRRLDFTIFNPYSVQNKNNLIPSKNIYNSYKKSVHLKKKSKNGQSIFLLHCFLRIRIRFVLEYQVHLKI